MRNLSFRSILIVAAVGFFALGLFSVVLPKRPKTDPTDRVAPSATAASPLAAADPRQRSVLVLGVDSFAGQPPELLAVWLASFRPPEPDVFVFGFPVDRRSDDGTTLRQAFAQSPQGGEAFLASIASLTPFPLDAVVALDATGFAVVIDFLGGVPTEAAPVGGASALQILLLLRDDPDAALLAQSRLLEALAVSAGSVRPGSDLQPLLDLIPSNAYVPSGAEALLTLIAPLLPLDPSRIHVSPVTSETPASG